MGGRRKEGSRAVGEGGGKRVKRKEEERGWKKNCWRKEKKEL